MAKVSYYLKNVKTGDEAPLYLKISHDYKSALLLAGKIRPEDWDAEHQTYIGRNTPFRSRLKNLAAQAVEIITELRYSGELAKMTAGDIASRIRQEAFGERPKKKVGDFLAALKDYRDSCFKPGTCEVYDRTVKALTVFDPSIDERSFNDINRAYLERFERHCRDTMAVNSIAILLRNIRTVFNKAIDDGKTDFYPFRTFKIKQQETRKRALTVEQLAWILNMEPLPGYEEARDIFMLSFYLIGINLADLLAAKKFSVKNGYLNYRRAKTGRLYSVKVEPEAAVLIRKYAGKSLLVNGLERYASENSYLSKINKRLKYLGCPRGKRGKILGEGRFPDLSTYWARHTWATIAYEIGIPVDIIGQALGHSDKSHSVTFIYIKEDQGKVDEANRRVIDYVLYGRDHREENTPQNK